MNYRRLGRSGLSVSEIGLGSYQTFGVTVDLEQTRRCVRTALELGVNYFDTADGYADGEAERMLGRILNEFPRESWIVGTKCFFPRSEAPTNRGLSRKHIVESVDRSLSNLRIDHIDLMQCHRFDPATPIEETVGAMEGLVRQGKILYWGMGRFSAAQIEETLQVARDLGARPPVAHQTLYSLLQRSIEEDVLPASEQVGVGNLVYGALGQGVLTGKYGGDGPPRGSRGTIPELREGMYDLDEQTVTRVADLQHVAREAGLTTAQLAMVWCLRQPAVSCVITGCTRPEQIEENAAASGLTADTQTLARIDAIMLS